MPIEEELDAPDDGAFTEQPVVKRPQIAEALQRLFYNMQTSENMCAVLPSFTHHTHTSTFISSSYSHSVLQRWNSLSHLGGAQLMPSSSTTSKNSTACS